MTDLDIALLTPFADRTDDQQDELNAFGWTEALRLIDAVVAGQGVGFEAARRIVAAELASEIAANKAEIKRAACKRATRLDRTAAAAAGARNLTLALIEGAIWDAAH